MPTRSALAAALVVLAACGSRGTGGSRTGGPPAAQQVAVEVRPASVSILPGETVEFTSLVTGTADPTVTWEVVEKGGGTVSTSGTYLAPLETGQYTVRAISRVSSTATSTAQVKVGHVAVSVSPTTATVSAGGSLAFAANVRGSKDKSVTWSLREPSGCGTIDPSGVYTAPAAAATCHAIAASVADPSAQGEAIATVAAPATPAPLPVVVAITPASGAVDACRTLAFTASVSGTSNGTVSWSVAEGDAGGTIASDGVYTAPAAAGTYHVVATSQAAPGSSTTAAVTVTDRILQVAVSPSAVTVAPGTSTQFTSTVTSTCGTFTSTQTVKAPN